MSFLKPFPSGVVFGLLSLAMSARPSRIPESRSIQQPLHMYPNVEMIFRPSIVPPVADVIQPILSKYLDSMIIPDHVIDFGELKIELTFMHTSNFTCENCLSATFLDGSILSVAAAPYGLEFYAHVVVTTPIFDTSTDAFVTLSQTDTAARVAINVQDCAEDTAAHTTHARRNHGHSPRRHDCGRLHCDALSVGTQTGDFKVTFQGGALGPVLDMLENVFNSTVRSLVTGTVSSVVRSAIDGPFNEFLAALPTFVPLPNASAPVADLRLDAYGKGIRSTSQLFRVPYVGTIVPRGPLPRPIPPQPQPVFPAELPAAARHAMMSLAFGADAIDAAAFVGAASLAPFVITHEDAQKWLPRSVAALNTSSMSWIAPGLATKYPDGRWMRVICAANLSSSAPPPTVTITHTEPPGVYVGADVAFHFVVDNGPDMPPADAFTVSCVLNSTFDVSARAIPEPPRFVIHGRVSYPFCDLVVDNSAVGNVRVTALSVIMAAFLDGLLVPAMNEKLAAGVFVDVPEEVPFSPTSAAIVPVSGLGIVLCGNVTARNRTSSTPLRLR
eukprot:TRINITY_DN20827_c0_g1_i1.p1 TRINITY_DN20827_c0_g1~~TRINITY_DN20827_c0_g1_i1.p1  ORF type:complete len:556 (+),score=115.72 TRINITY_DN20827_c0_g1_i1:197-1864(+)